ncbi:DUF4199 domain-containing protein [Mucilaginibacter sp. FT3.2]|uniref:DUF4199 domain-containing protein n=1 Tax=Mucilaginibacter sp. FT3.2 TaxID=2723090 RepID=UPI0016211A8E|nr:DUF4199 domain-containing protein [Mucilaginibacter sp. FT3.2]MBB6234122.1 hypothetical protein [Mucilaginibacter sp. FT3.2]
METKKASPSVPAIKWALISLIASIIITYAFQFLNLDINSKIRWVNYLVFIAFLCLTQKEYRDQLGGYMTFGEGFLSGFLYSVFLGALTAVFTYIYFAILSPDMISKILAASEAKLSSDGLSPEQKDQAMSMTSKFVTAPVMAVFGFVGSLIMGAIVALIGAAIFKKERSPFDVPGYNDPQPSDSTV